MVSSKFDSKPQKHIYKRKLQNNCHLSPDCHLSQINNLLHKTIHFSYNNNIKYFVLPTVTCTLLINFLIHILMRNKNLKFMEKVSLTCKYWRLYKLNQFINLNKKLNIHFKMSTGKNEVKEIPIKCVANEDQLLEAIPSKTNFSRLVFVPFFPHPKKN